MNYYSFIAFAILNLSFSPLGNTFTLTLPQTKGYANPEITIMINQASCPAELDLSKIVKDAVEVWNRVPWSKLKLTVGGKTTTATSSFPPVAYCDPTITGSTLGLGGSAGNSENYLVRGSLRLNTNAGTAGYVLDQNYDQIVLVAAHEIGHVLGIGHSNDDFALMNYTIGEKTTMNLSQDDIDAVSYLYARDELSGQEMMGGCAGIRNIKSTQHPWMTLLFLLVPFLLWVLAHRQAKQQI